MLVRVVAPLRAGGRRSQVSRAEVEMRWSKWVVKMRGSKWVVEIGAAEIKAVKSGSNRRRCSRRGPNPGSQVSGGQIRAVESER